MQNIVFKDYERLIVKTACRVHMRLHAAGARSVQLEDVKQELAIAWCVARDTWSPEHNVPFVAYLMRGMYLHVNRWVQREIGHAVAAALSLDESVDEDGDTQICEIIPDNSLQPADEALAERELKALVLDELRPRARQFLEILSNPPDEVLDEVLALRAKAEVSRSRGQAASAFSHLHPSIVFDLMAAPRHERVEVIREIKAAAEKVSKL